MQYSNFLRFIALLAFAACAAGCATTQPAQPAHTIPVIAQDATQQTPPQPKSAASVAPILKHVSSVTSLNTPPTIASGTDDEGVWVEGSGVFSGSLADVYDDLIDPLVIGPVHMTKNITMSDLQASETRTTYVMHVKMRYIVSVEFDLAALIEPFFDENGEQIGWTYVSEKIAGSRFLSKVSTFLIIRKTENDAFQVDFRSENVATMDKESEARRHLETLFDYWKNKSIERKK